MIIIDEEMFLELRSGRAISVKVNLLKEEADYLYKALPNKGSVLVLTEETKQVISCVVLGVAKAETEPKLLDAGFQTLYLRIFNPSIPINVKSDAIAEAIFRGISDCFTQEGIEE